MTGLAYKVLDENRRACHGGTGTWPAPNGKPGAWLTVKGELIPCRRGLHLCRREDLVHWLGPTTWVAEYEGEPIVHENKIVVGKARLVEQLATWNERTSRLFAADCADKALRDTKKLTGWSDPRCAAATKAARDYANGLIDRTALTAANRAAHSAAWSAAHSAGSAARDAAREAAWEAARSAACSAACSARSAALSAALSAARSAAWSAACSAAGDSAARRWQTKRLFEILDGKRHAT